MIGFQTRKPRAFRYRPASGRRYDIDFHKDLRSKPRQFSLPLLVLLILLLILCIYI